MNKSLFVLCSAFILSGVFITLGIIGLVYTWPIFLVLSFFLALGISLFAGIHLICSFKSLAQNLEHNISKMSEGDLTPDAPLVRTVPEGMARLLDSLAKLGREMEIIIEERERANRMHEDILSGLDQGVVVLDEQARVMLETPLARKLLQGSGYKNLDNFDAPESEEWSTRELVEAPFYMRGVHSHHLWEVMVEAMDSGIPDSVLMSVASEDDLRYIEAFTKAIETEEFKGALAVLRDVTRVQQLERMREDFVTNVTHELKTPLTSIKGYVELLRSAPRSPEDQDAFLEIIEIETDRLQNLISDILELSEIQDGDGQRTKNDLVYVFAAVQQVFQDLEGLAEKMKVKLFADMDFNFRLRGNEARVNLLLTNLITNAIKYNREGGTVTVIGRDERSRKILQVKDTGIGMEKSELPRIFERFYRVSKSRSKDVAGTGLGLAIVKHTVSLFGGSIQVDSTPGEGTIFTIIFPK